MQYAHLWKRILNEGIPINDVILPDAVETFEAEIIKSPIVVGPVLDDSEGAEPDYEWAKYRLLDIPFGLFWSEWSQKSGILFGCLVESKKNDLGFEVAVLMVSGAKGQPLFVTAFMRITLDAHGSVVLNENGGVNFQGIVSPRLRHAAGDRHANEVVLSQVACLCELMQVLGCKNVSLKPNDGDPQQVRRAVKRFGGDPDSYRYHTLVVRPPGARSDSPAQDIGIMPRHVCRGHFSEYGPEFGKGLLFGKYAGRFYIPPHLKGDKKNGVVEKDYIVTSATLPPQYPQLHTQPVHQS